MSESPDVPWSDYQEYPIDQMQERAAGFCAEMQRRRSIRQFSDRSVPREVIENCLRAAASAPSGANRQPWHFVAVGDRGVKRRIREAAEQREREFYQRRAPKEWLDALKPLGTGWEKPFLTAAPYLIAVFAQRHGMRRDTAEQERTIEKNYFVTESVGIATGILIAAIHHAGLASLPYTPMPMGFLNDILHRPPEERPLFLLVVGYPAQDARVPPLEKKPLEEVATFV